MPDISQCSTGRKIIMKSGSPEGSANSSYISRSKMTSRMLYFKGVVDIDTFIQKSKPDKNWSDYAYLMITMFSNGTDACRTLIKAPKSKICHLHQHGYPQVIRIIEVYEIEPADFKIKEVTWNNQPDLGAFITSFDCASGPEWIAFPTGTAGAFLMKWQNETDLNQYLYYRSWNWADKDYRPYFTDE